jgi:2-iminobutanoate/2-iminopropanoate deaminase
MTLDVVATAGAPKAIGPYSQAITAGGFVFTAGQVALDPATGELMVGGIADQTTRALENLRAVPPGRACPRSSRRRFSWLTWRTLRT